MLNKLIKYFLENKLVTVIILTALIAWGIATAPFGWQIGVLPSDPVPVDAIPDIGENQQIVFTEWMGRSPQDIEDQISYPLTTYLLGIPGVKSIRSSSVFGFSSIYIIFNEDIEFYWSRSRILEKMNSIPPGFLPDGAQPALGPDATALGQVYWYTLEGRDKGGNPTGGWDLHEIRSVQDFYVKYGLNAVEGVSEVASIGGFVKEYQIDVNPDALKAYNIPLYKVMMAIGKSNRDVGAKTIEINQAEYLVRGLGYVKNVQDIEKAVVAVQDNVPIRIRDIGIVSLGPATRRGALDKDGAETAGGVVVARYGANPLQVINSVKAKIQEISPGLPKKTLVGGVESQLTIVPFYDRSELIHETLGTLEEALSLQILITLLVIIVMIYNLRASIMISGLLPIAVLMVFIAMRYAGVDANIVALSGIAIAIGTMVDLGIILSENVIRHINEAPSGQKLTESVYKGASEVSSAILTAVSTTIVSFIPVFSLEAAEGKLFGPLAFTKTFALIAALMVALFILPMFADWFFGFRIKSKKVGQWVSILMLTAGIVFVFAGAIWGGTVLILMAVSRFLKQVVNIPEKESRRRHHWLLQHAELIISVVAVVWLLAGYWLPLGPGRSIVSNIVFVALLVALILGFFSILEYFYTHVLGWCLENRVKFLLIPSFFILFGLTIWMGFNTIFGFVAKGCDLVGWNIRTTKAWSGPDHAFPGIGKEFMPSLNEGSFLLMPTSMAHSGIEYNRNVLAQLDMALTGIPEVALTVGKLGRVESALDPAPKLQPIETRLVMLQTGMRAPMGIKVYGPDLKSIENFGFALEGILKQVPSVKAEAVFADRVIGKPYLHLNINRETISRYGLTIEDVHQVIETAIGGMEITSTVEGRERFPVRVRYPRELRNDPESLGKIWIPTAHGITDTPGTSG